LDDAAKQMGKVRSGPIAAELRRVRGDCFASAGDGDSARKAYLEGEEIGGSPRRFSEKAAWRGAHARSTEEFLKQKQFDRAAEEIQAWQREFPAEKIEGYLTLLEARYWAGRGRHAQAIAQAEQLQGVNRDSPYLDQILFVAADSEMRLGHKDRALATLQSVLKDCPGSPMVPLAKKNIELIESGKEGRKD
jgi:predicted negative regulator of RcsB-dependent stress response